MVSKVVEFHNSIITEWSEYGNNKYATIPVQFQYNGNQRKGKENMPSKEFDKILSDFYIPLVGK